MHTFSRQQFLPLFVIPEVDESKAAIYLAQRPRPLARKRKILKVELLYVPCYVFKIKVESRAGIQATEQVCVDGIQGQFAFFKGASISESCQRRCRKFDFIIPLSEAEMMALEEYKRHQLKLNLKHKTVTAISSIDLDQKIYYPYWIGYFRRKQALDFEVIDGISAAKQGVKMRSLFINLLLQQNH